MYMYWISVSDIQINVAAIAHVGYWLENELLFAEIHYTTGETATVNGDVATQLRAHIAVLAHQSRQFGPID